MGRREGRRDHEEEGVGGRIKFEGSAADGEKNDVIATFLHVKLDQLSFTSS